mmetsp:Transcript_4584/g.9173  ORF Transcript_4584/g.9173 Transcript_4584/m.9173 type:complete len:210 (-) Transcript_4584:369-998(-)
MPLPRNLLLRHLHSWRCVGGRFSTLRSCSSINNARPREIPGGSYFQLLHDAQVRYDVDLELVAARYKALQRQWHPDKLASTEGAESGPRIAAASAMINRAYETLKDPYRRAMYMLELAGVSVDEVEQQVLDPQMLAHVFEVDEAIDDSDGEKGTLARIREANNVELERVDRDLRNAFATNEYEVAKRLSAELRYYQRLDHRISELLSVQ